MALYLMYVYTSEVFTTFCRYIKDIYYKTLTHKIRTI